MNTAKKTDARVLATLRNFLHLESAGGVFLLLATVMAMLAANSPLAGLYSDLLNTTVAVQAGALMISKPLLLWVNDGLMAIFFFVIGLEIKREILEGELSSRAQVVLPALGAAGGMLVPAAIYIFFNRHDMAALEGWAIPAATDIAFALGLLTLFGSRVPSSLKIFLLTLAIFDDLAAIAIIALFYSGKLSLLALIIGAAILALAMFLNYRGVNRVSIYALLGLVLWIAVLKSGVHATLAGVLMAFCIPMRAHGGKSPLHELEDDLHTPVVFAILPVFAFANAGLSLSGLSIQDLLEPVTAGIVLGLLLGKPLGILLFCGLGVWLGWTMLPKGVSWMQISGVACVCGIGFTMSLFITGLAFEHSTGIEYYGGGRLGILLGSLLSALLASLILYWSLPVRAQEEEEENQHIFSQTPS